MSDRTILEEVDAAFQQWGRAAPPMRADENDTRYINRVARIAQKKNYLAYDEPARKVDFTELPANARPQFTQMLLEGIKRSVARPDTVPAGEMRARHTTTGDHGARCIEWIGSESFVRALTLPARRVVQINVPAPERTLYRKNDTR